MQMDDPLDAAGPGHNRPPYEIPSPEAISEALALDNYRLARRKDELVEAYARVPAEIDSLDLEQRVTDFGSQVNACIKAAEAARVAAKEPYLTGGRAVDGFFGAALTDPLLEIRRKVGERLTAYKVKREREERKRREEEAAVRAAAERRARDDQAAREAAMRSEADLKAAVEAGKAADQAAGERAQAEKAATVKAAELSGSRGDMGGYSSLRTFWDFRDLSRESLDLEALRSHFPHDGLERAVRAFIKAGGRELEGVEIYERHSTQIR